MINENELVRCGYKSFEAIKSWKFSDLFFQKKVSDEIGIKYFINLVRYPAEDSVPKSWMAQLDNNEPHMTFQIHKPTSLEEVEQQMELFWKTMGCEYYEREL